jgi:two-component system, OmpR family, response regulator
MSAVEPAAILFVEDESLIREFLTMALEDAGFEVVVAENGAAALEALDHNPDPFCAILADINLGPGPDGWEVARRARELNRELPVVYPAHPIIRNSFGSMTRKLSVTSSQ